MFFFFVVVVVVVMVALKALSMCCLGVGAVRTCIHRGCGTGLDAESSLSGVYGAGKLSKQESKQEGFNRELLACLPV